MSETKDDAHLRLVEARIKAGFKHAKDAARYFGWNYNTYSQHENGERGLIRMSDRYAKAFRVSEAWLLTGEGQATMDGPGTVVPILSWVSAGEMEAPDYVESLRDLPTINAGHLPEKGEWVALEVVGDSMNRISPPGSIIVVNTKNRKLVPNACYVIINPDDGTATYKRYRPNPERFEPVSTVEEHKTIFPKGPVTILGRVRKSMLEM